MLKPLLLDEINVPFWVRLLPFSRCSYSKKLINRVLSSRDSYEVEMAWKDVDIPYKNTENILNIIAKYCDWKTNKFIPTDECLCVFLDHDLELGSITALLEIEDFYSSINSELLDECIISNSTLLDFIHLVICNSV